MSSNIWQPATPAQQMALDCEADLLFFGGAAGSLKSHTLLLDGIQERENKNLRAIFFRESYPQILDLVDKAQRIYRPLGASYNEQKKIWTFPSGAQCRFGYLARDADVYEYFGHEFSFIGVDESTRHTEKRLRLIISRLRTTDPFLKRRVRWGSNPGGPSASMHQSIFLNGACPVHEPEKCAVPGRIYTGRTWPSDGKDIPLSVAFIPGHLTDHGLLGDEYIKLLRMQQGELADALEKGCWCQLQGAYFAKAWDRVRCVSPIAEILQRYWYQYWIALDYGVGRSWAAATLFMKTPPMEGFPDGRIYLVGELCIPDNSANEFGHRVANAFIAPIVERREEEEYRRNFVAVFADPANFNPDYDLRRGTGGHSVSDQIDEVLKDYGLSCQRASNDRIGGWQLLYKMLKDGSFVIGDNCPMAQEAIRSRVHDEERPGDVMKIKGDPLDDIADSVRYGLYSFINLPKKPNDERLRDAAERCAPEDITSRVIAIQKEQKRIWEENHPPAFGGSTRQRLMQLQRRGR